MAKVVLSDEVARQLEQLTNPVLARVLAVIERLGKWSAVSGAKPLR